MKLASKIWFAVAGVDFAIGNICGFVYRQYDAAGFHVVCAIFWLLIALRAEEDRSL